MNLIFGDPIPTKPNGYDKIFVGRCKKERPDLVDKPLEFIQYVMNHPDRSYDIRESTIERYLRN